MYSPTQTTTYSVCPLKWYLSYKHKGVGLTTPYLSTRIASLISGSAVQAGLTAWYAGAKEHKEVALDAVLHVAQAQMEERFAEFVEAAVQMDDMPTPEDVWKEVQRILSGYVRKYPRENWREIIGVELELKYPSHMFLDALVIDYDGQPAVFESKIVSAKVKDLAMLYPQYGMNYQVTHYCWGASKHLQKPVRRVIMNLMSRKAKPEFERLPIEMPEHLYQIHKESSQWRWGQMGAIEQDEGITYGNMANWEACRGRYGVCDFFDLCKSGWDENVEMLKFKPRKVKEEE